MRIVTGFRNRTRSGDVWEKFRGLIATRGGQRIGRPLGVGMLSHPGLEGGVPLRPRLCPDAAHRPR